MSAISGTKRNRKRQCRKCSGRMKRSIALAQTYLVPERAKRDPSLQCTISPGGPGKIIPCDKCTRCGWSVTV